MAALLLAAAGCSSSTDPGNVAWEATLAPVAGSGITGTAGAVTQAGRTAATIQIRKAMAGETYGWRIDSGGCDGSGSIQGGSALYPELTPDGSGTASADAGIPGTLDRGTSYAVRVFVAGAADIVACGDLQPG